MKRFFAAFFFIMLVSLASPAFAANCSNCHHVDFQPSKMSRKTNCWTCHGTADHAMGKYTQTYVPGVGWFRDNGDYLSSNATLIHSKHNGVNGYNTTGCDTCHAQADCRLCHNNVNHVSHGSPDYTAPLYSYSDGTRLRTPTGWGATLSTPISCSLSQCHKWWTTGGPVYPTSATKSLCLNCHSDPHGTQPSSNDEAGVICNPNVNPALSNISVKWKYFNGDTLKKSFDGINWTNLSVSGATNGQYYTYIDTGVANWSVVYYKIIRSDDSQNYFPVYPPGTNAHTNYLDNTQLCAACHVTHTAEQAKLLKEQSTEDLCRTCHGLANTGSRYNVDTGEVVSSGTIDSNGLITAVTYIKSNSGAFGIESGGKRFAGNHVGTWGGAEVTSTHSISSYNTSIAPGGGDNGVRLTCTSCHLSHPKKNSYRLLTIGTVEAYAVNPDGTHEKTNYIRDMNTGCGCHKQYIVPQNSGHVTTTSYYRHPVGVAIQGPYASVNTITYTPWSLTTTLPTEYNTFYNNAYRVAGSLSGSAPTQYVQNGAVFCLTCHYAHGTTSTGESNSAYDINSDTLLNDKSTMLKRLNNNDICQNCHKK